MITCWISVKDKLPTVSDENHCRGVSANVLVFCEGGTICVAYLVQDRNTKKLSWYTFDPAGWDLDDVTHWMPLPKPPARRLIWETLFGC